MSNTQGKITKVFNLPESNNENVRAKFAEMVKNVTGHDVDEREIFLQYIGSLERMEPLNH